MRNCHLCSEDYAEVKRRLSMRQAAAFYGYPAGRNGFCRCPFHKDACPSMKLYGNDKGFYCFACGQGGDVVTFVKLLYGLTNEAACRKLIEDFALPVVVQPEDYRGKRERDKQIRREQKLRQFGVEAKAVLSVYRMLLCRAAQDPADPHFEEALQELSLVEYRLDCLETDREAYYADEGAVRKIGEIKTRINQWNCAPEAGGGLSGRSLLSDL